MVDGRRSNDDKRAANVRRSESALQTLTSGGHAPSHALLDSERTQLCLGRPPTLSPFSNTSAVQSLSNNFVPRSKKSRRPRPVRNNDSLWFLFLILSSLSPDKQLLPPTFDTHLAMDSTNVRKLFDPMIGEFCADTSPQVLDKFFNSRMRWRDDNAWYPQQIQANMMMTEQPPRLMRNSNPSAVETNTTQGNEPTLADFDAIDIYWRQDIEREKGIAPIYPINYAGPNNGQGCSTSSQMCDVSEQVERDLQLLREKSLFAPLTHEENYRYENLSKAHYIDFYRTVPPAAAKRWQSASNASSTSGYSNNTEQFRPMSPAKSNISSFDENEAANFFSNLAKQSQMEENRAQMQVPQQLPTYSNLTLCADQSNVLNNVSLAQQANLPGVYANDSFFMSNPSGNGIRGSAVFEQQPQPEPTMADDILNGITDQALEISESEASTIWSSMQNSHDLDEVVQLREFTAMEILGEFQPNATANNRTDSPIPENVLTCVDRETSPSSGIGSMQSSSSSPNHNEDFGFSENDDQNYRFYDKLAPKVRNHRASFSTDASADSFKRPQSAYQRKQAKLRGAALAEKQNGAQRKRGRQSKDEQLAQDHFLPASAEEFAAMTHIEIQKYMRDPKLSTLQKALIKKIRRRGRNKIAARKCRDRRTFYGQPDGFYVKDELQSNYDPNEMSLYDF